MFHLLMATVTNWQRHSLDMHACCCMENAQCPGFLGRTTETWRDTSTLYIYLHSILQWKGEDCYHWCQWRLMLDQQTNCARIRDGSWLWRNTIQDAVTELSWASVRIGHHTAFSKASNTEMWAIWTSSRCHSTTVTSWVDRIIFTGN